MNDGLANGNQLISFSFTTFNAVDAEGNPCIKLSSVKPTGYENNAAVTKKGGINGDYVMQVLATTGKMFESYSWVHKCSKVDDPTQAVWQEGYWKSTKGTVSADNDVLIRPGMGFWCNLNARYNIQGASVLNSGEAVVDSYTIPLTNGNQVVGVPTSFSVPISKIKPTGYENNAAVTKKGGINGDYVMQVLKTDGKMFESYSWVHKCSKVDDPAQAVWQEGYWKSTKGTVSAANESYLPVGTAVWCNLNSRYNIQNAALVFPGMSELD